MLSTADSSGRIQIIAPDPLGVVALSNTENAPANSVPGLTDLLTSIG